MFKKTDPNPQLDIFTAPSMQLGSRASKKYSDPNAWHNQFYSLVTTKIDEEIFKPLFPEGKESEFIVNLTGRPSFQWECPDLIPFEYNGKRKWVLIVSVNPCGPVLGSGTMYFVGDFDGKHFTADDLDYPLWLDYGMDNYAGVTWNNTGDTHLLIMLEPISAMLA